MGKKGKISLYPEDKSEYFKIWRWQISKRLVYAALLALGIMSLFYIIASGLPWKFEKEYIKTYSYDSVFLPYVSGHVKIRSGAGYIAYDGDVEDGFASGNGRLYDRNGGLVYEGEFKESEYSGKGKLYDKSGRLLYEGDFAHNLYEGEGTQYCEKEIYEGSFVRGVRQGNGVLKDESGNAVYSGGFSNGEIVYGDFPGKTTEAAGDIYSGRRAVYYNDEYFIVHMKDIDAFYSADSESGSLEDTVSINRVFVIKNTYSSGQSEADKIDELIKLMGEPSYEGNLYINAEEAVTLGNDGGLKTEEVFDDVFEIKEFDKNTMLYVYDFRWDGLKYTFYCGDKSGSFIMYSIEGLEE